MNVLVCIKRVPATAGHITLTPDAQDIDTHYLGFTISPHEECAVEEAVRLQEQHGGTTTVLTLGPDAAVDQLRDAMALGIERGILLEAKDREWDPVATAAAIAEAVEAERAAGRTYDLLLFGNESADSAGYPVGVRVADALDLPCVTGIKAVATSAFSRFSTSKPSIFGIMTSSSTRSGGCSAASRSAVSPSWAGITSYPSACSRI